MLRGISHLLWRCSKHVRSPRLQLGPHEQLLSIVEESFQGIAGERAGTELGQPLCCESGGAARSHLFPLLFVFFFFFLLLFVSYPATSPTTIPQHASSSWAKRNFCP
jgi:hypothetical protein